MTSWQLTLEKTKQGLLLTVLYIFSSVVACVVCRNPDKQRLLAIKYAGTVAYLVNI